MKYKRCIACFLLYILAFIVVAQAPGDRVVFIGDSIFELWGREHGKFFPGEPYVNRGISGQATWQMLLRFRADVIKVRPDVVVILGGTNDIAGVRGPQTLDQIENNIASMAQLAQANGIRVVLAAVLPVCDCFTGQTAQHPKGKIIALNAWIERYASQNEFIYLDYYSSMADPNGLLRKELTFDGLHPNDAGYALMAPLTARAIAQARERPASACTR